MVLFGGNAEIIAFSIIYYIRNHSMKRKNACILLQMRICSFFSNRAFAYNMYILDPALINAKEELEFAHRRYLSRCMSLDNVILTLFVVRCVPIYMAGLPRWQPRYHL